MFKRKRVLVPVAMLATLGVAASAPASTGTSTTVKSRSTSKGQLLATRTGHLLYVFAPDLKHHKEMCVKFTGCTGVWPPLTTNGKPLAGKGVQASKLGTIKLPSGKKQVTYNGDPLYRWTSDPGGGDTSYLGINSTGGKWYAITTSGKVVK